MLTGVTFVFWLLVIYINYPLPVGQSPIYKAPEMIHSLNDFVTNGWEKMKLHELTQTM